MTFTTKQDGLKKKLDPKGSAGKFLQKAGEEAKAAPSSGRKVLGLKKKKPAFKKKAPPKRTSGSAGKKGQPSGQHKPPPWMHVAKGK